MHRLGTHIEESQSSMCVCVIGKHNLCRLQPNQVNLPIKLE